MDILTIVVSLFVLLFAITIHEASHGWAAHRLGDPTAYALGRVSLNPVVHIDPLGTVILPVLLVLIGAPAFGWAKPVPVNPYNLRDPRKDNLWISFAGPAANLIAAAAALIGILVLKALHPALTQFYRSYLVYRQGFPRGFYPLEGLGLILFYGVLVNTYLVVFNLIPVPPLDGSGILAGLLSPQGAQRYERIRPYGFLIVVVLVYLGFLDLIVRPIQIVLFGLIFY